MSTLLRIQIENALTQLGNLALTEQTSIELLVMGGAAMVLGYQARESTHDIDALIVKPQTARLVREWAARVGQTLKLEEDWLNDGAKGFLHGIDVGPVWRDDVDINDATRLLDNLVKQDMDQVSI